MTTEERNSKRPRCPEDSFINQTKQYIVQRRIDLNDQDSMRAIFSKRVYKIFGYFLIKR